MPRRATLWERSRNGGRCVAVPLSPDAVAARRWLPRRAEDVGDGAGRRRRAGARSHSQRHVDEAPIAIATALSPTRLSITVTALPIVKHWVRASGGTAALGERARPSSWPERAREDRARTR